MRTRPVFKETTTLCLCGLFWWTLPPDHDLNQPNTASLFIHTLLCPVAHKEFLPCLPSCYQLASPPSGRKRTWQARTNLSGFSSKQRDWDKFPRAHTVKTAATDGLFISCASLAYIHRPTSCCTFTSLFHISASHKDVSAAAVAAAAAAVRCTALPLPLPLSPPYSSSCNKFPPSDLRNVCLIIMP